MTVWDDRILEIAEQEGGVSVGELDSHPYIRVSNSQISRRCKRLAEHGLLKPIGSGAYIITERGRKYLEGELDTHEDRADDPIEAEDETDEPATTESTESPEEPG